MPEKNVEVGVGDVADTYEPREDSQSDWARLSEAREGSDPLSVLELQTADGTKSKRKWIWLAIAGAFFGSLIIAAVSTAGGEDNATEDGAQDTAPAAPSFWDRDADGDGVPNGVDGAWHDPSWSESGPKPLPDADGDGVPDTRDGEPNDASWSESGPKPPRIWASYPEVGGVTVSITDVELVDVAATTDLDTRGECSSEIGSSAEIYGTPANATKCVRIEWSFDVSASLPEGEQGSLSPGDLVSGGKTIGQAIFNDGRPGTVGNKIDAIYVLPTGQPEGKVYFTVRGSGGEEFSWVLPTAEITVR